MWGLMFRLLAGASAAYLFISGIPYFIKLYDALKAYMAYRKLTRELEKSGCEPSLNPVQPSSSSLRHRHTTVTIDNKSIYYVLNFIYYGRYRIMNSVISIYWKKTREKY
ncbi:hypothetical protein BDB01DRAFT_796402 [Pilobolus umbonatus]|nr:hypothetical protein BDB01DRAFT_796402 [Pilobolus umbonatus]